MGDAYVVDNVVVDAGKMLGWFQLEDPKESRIGSHTQNLDRTNLS
jgi:hypothetical protein